MNYIKRSILLIITLIVAFGVKAQHVADRLDSLMLALHGRGQFNGSILVSVKGKLLYEKAYGKADIKNNIDCSTSSTCFHLASVSKQFTAMAIMILKEQKRLGLDDHLDKFFPDFPNGQKITIRQLLNHTSGIVNYEGLGIDNPRLTKQKFYNGLVEHRTLQFNPGDKYEYSNSGYVLLAMIVEKITGMPFADFLKKNIFQPIKMENTFVFSRSVARTKSIARSYGKFGDEDKNNVGVEDSARTAGDGGIFSTADDMFKWDKALYTNTLVSQSTLMQAFTPAILNNGTKSFYGFGWMLKQDGNDTIVYHTGGSGGFRTYIERHLDNHNSIIILTNMENSPRREISEAINNIIQGRPYQLPKISISTEMYNIRNNKGIDAAIEFYKNSKVNKNDTYDFSEQELNLLGYQLWSLNKIDETIEIFKLNVSAYPGSSNTYESLGEAYLERGDKQLAAESFNKSLSIDLKNSDAIRMLNKINGQ